MAEQQIIITIDEQGKLTAKTQGFKGTACVEAIADILGREQNILSTRKTDEYFEKNHLQAKQLVTNQRNG